MALIKLTTRRHLVRDQTTGGAAFDSPSMPVSDPLPSASSAQESPLVALPVAGARNSSASVTEAMVRAYLLQAAQRLSPALLYIAHQSTAKSRDRAFAAFIVLVYGPTPFGGVNTIKEVSKRYGMTERNLFQLMETIRSLLQSEAEAEANLTTI